MKLKKVLKNFISFCITITIIISICIIIFHSIFLKYDYIRLKNNQQAVFSIAREYKENYNPALIYKPKYIYFGLGYNIIPEINKENKAIIKVESYFGFQFIDKYIVDSDKYIYEIIQRIKK